MARQIYTIDDIKFKKADKSPKPPNSVMRASIKSLVSVVTTLHRELSKPFLGIHPEEIMYSDVYDYVIKVIDPDCLSIDEATEKRILGEIIVNLSGLVKTLYEELDDPSITNRKN